MKSNGNNSKAKHCSGCCLSCPLDVRLRRAVQDADSTEQKMRILMRLAIVALEQYQELQAAEPS
jgi:hypothetical protein